MKEVRGRFSLMLQQLEKRIAEAKVIEKDIRVDTLKYYYFPFDK